MRKARKAGAGLLATLFLAAAAFAVPAGSATAASDAGGSRSAVDAKEKCKKGFVRKKQTCVAAKKTCKKGFVKEKQTCVRKRRKAPTAPAPTGPKPTPPTAPVPAAPPWADGRWAGHYSLLVRGIELDVLPTAQRHGMGILTYSPLAGGWLSGSWTADSSPTSPARQRLVARFDMSLPENQRKLEATQELARVADDAGPSVIDLAIAFVVNHPAVTSAIIGPRTMEQLESQLPAVDVTLDPATLDRIDEIIRPGVNLNPADTSYGEQVLQPALRRR
jgi:hypothetical protein